MKKLGKDKLTYIVYISVQLIIASLILFLVAFVIAAANKIDFNQLLNTITGTNIIIEYSKFAILTNVVTNFIVYLGLFVFLFILFKKDLKNDLILFKEDNQLLENKIILVGKIKSNKIRYIVVYLIGVILIICFSLLVQLIGNILNIDLNTTNQNDIVNMIKYYKILPFFFVVFFAPFVEEIVFRKSIFMTSKNKVIYYLASIFLFAIIHIVSSLSSSMNVGAVLFSILPYLFSALVLSYVFEKEQNIHLNYLIHLTNNLVSYIFVVIA